MFLKEEYKIESLEENSNSSFYKEVRQSSRVQSSIQKQLTVFDIEPSEDE
jgi:hypothetical protein